MMIFPTGGKGGPSDKDFIVIFSLCFGIPMLGWFLFWLGRGIFTGVWAF